MKNRTVGESISARKRALTRMRLYGLNPKHQILDNEPSEKHKEAIQASGRTYQLLPPDDHRQNISEKAIQFWKDHFISILSGTAENFPLHLWCQVIQQAERQLLMLRLKY